MHTINRRARHDYKPDFLAAQANLLQRGPLKLLFFSLFCSSNYMHAQEEKVNAEHIACLFSQVCNICYVYFKEENAVLSLLNIGNLWKCFILEK